MENCRFCEIIRNDRENEEIIFENSQFVAITDRYRRTSAGAICLIITKEHKRNLLELKADSGNGLIDTIKLISKTMQTAYNCKGIRIWTAINKEAGQSIFHCHIHVVPCKTLLDRIIASFPGLYDLLKKFLTFGNNELSKKMNFELAEELRVRDYPLNCVNEDLLLHFINHFPGQR
jgi:histidine triad (HIT) family protein